LTFFDGKIDVSEIEIQKLPTIKELQDDVDTKKKELAEKKIQLDAIKNQNTLQGRIDSLKKSIATTKPLIEKVRNKPNYLKTKSDNETLINETLKKSVTDTQIKIAKRTTKLKRERIFEIKKDEKKQYEDDLKNTKTIISYFQDRQDIYEIEEILDEPFEKLYDKFSKTYNAFAGLEAQEKEEKI
jgi:ribosomal protein L29